MIHIFNRKELITVQSDQRLYRIQDALYAAGIPYHTKVKVPFFTSDRYRGTPFIQQDFTHPSTIYVKSDDYERACAAMQTALR